MKHHQTLRRGLGVLLALLLCLTLLPMTALAEEPETGSVAIDETNFPDANFRAYISENFDLPDSEGNKDGTLSAEEIADVKGIDCSYMDIADLTGIEHFTALVELYCGHNQLTTLDVSNNTELQSLECGYNQLNSLDVSKNTKLVKLDCSGSKLTSLDVSNNTELQSLECGYNQLTSLDVSKNTKLGYLYCSGNELTSLDVSRNTELWYLDCDSNYLTSLDVSKNTVLEYLDCDGNQLTSLDISKNTVLEYLDCYGNQLTALDVSNNTALEYLYCGWNQLTALDVSKNTVLEELHCGHNQLTALDLSKNTVLEELYCVDNSYDITLDANGTFDLSTLPGNFDISKARDWTGGTVSGTILTVNADATTVTYGYDCGNEKSAFFTLDATPKYTVTANGIYSDHYLSSGVEPGETLTLDYAAGAYVALLIGKRDGYTLKDLMLVGITEKDLTWSAKGVEDEGRAISFTMPENDVTITVNWTKNGSGSGSSSSGGGFSGVYNYPVRVDSTDIHGAAVTLDKNNAVAGDKVTITVTPDAGKMVDEVIVTDADGKAITVSKTGNNQYTFTMPEGKVNIAVTTKAAEYQNKIVLQIGNRNILDNNTTITNDVAPVIVDNRTMVPIRVITETLGGTAHWDADTRTVTLNIDGKTLTMTIGQTISGFDVAPIILNDRTYVPVRYVAEMLGASVEWDGTTQQIIITK